MYTNEQIDKNGIKFIDLSSIPRNMYEGVLVVTPEIIISDRPVLYALAEKYKTIIGFDSERNDFYLELPNKKKTWLFEYQEVGPKCSESFIVDYNKDEFSKNYKDKNTEDALKITKPFIESYLTKKKGKNKNV